MQAQIVVGLAVSSMVAAALACSDTVSTRYATYAEAERDGAVARGWIPSYVPGSARQLEESHDLDTNLQSLTFFAPPDDLRRMAEHLTPATAAEVGRAKEARRNPALAHYRDVNRTAGPPLCFELDFVQGRGEMWSCSAGGDRSGHARRESRAPDTAAGASESVGVRQ